jgi:hypothetical protein
VTTVCCRAPRAHLRRGARHGRRQRHLGARRRHQHRRADLDPSISVGGGDASTSGSDGAGSGTQALIDVVLPVTLGGNAVSVLGDAESTDAATSQP